MKPLIKTAIFIVLVPGTVTGLLPYLLVRGHAHLTPSGWRWAGTAPLVLGAWIALWCTWEFSTAGQGTPAPISPPRVLVRRGLYRWVRNPMYLGALLVLAGETILFGSLTLLEYACIVALLFHLFVVLYEEPELARKFGADYASYRQNVPRWLPRPPRSRGKSEGLLNEDYRST
ncbi:MAG: isoprenylcysteine carboxylmethyltransferase family protein [Acidobacteriota bacterium]